MSENGMRNELSAMQLRADQVTDQSLESTRNMLRYGAEAQEAGVKALEMLDEQGDQLNRIDEGIHQINQDMKLAERNLQNMQKCCGLCVCPWNRTSNIEETEAYQKAWRSENDGDVVRDERGRTTASTSQMTSSGGYIQRITNDAREEEMDENLQQVHGIISNLKNMAVDMGTEISRQNVQLDKITGTAGMTGDRIEAANKTATKILKQ